MYIKEFEKFIQKPYKNGEGELVVPYYYIGEDDWSSMKEQYEVDDIKETLAEILMKYEPPYMEIDEQDALDDFKALKGLGIHDLNEYVEVKKSVNTDYFGSFTMTDTQEEDFQKATNKRTKQSQQSLFTETPWFARSEYEWPLSNRVLKRLNAGNKASNFFQQKNRWSVDGSVSPGPLRTWTNKSFMTSLMGSLFTLKAPRVDKRAMRTSIGLRKYICSQFKPNVAKFIYDFYPASLEGRTTHPAKTVLDFSMGWGDRFAGFYASSVAEHYIGIDPRKENRPIYQQQADFYEKFKTEYEVRKTYNFITSPAEDADLSEYENSVDLIMTSPPYFSVERYSYDDTQSWVRHKNINDWNEQFLHRAIDNVWKTLKVGGLLMVNISDVNATSKGTKGGKQWQKICDPMNEHLSRKSDSSYVECFGMEMAKRPNCLGIGTADDIEDSNMDQEYHEREGSFGEPVWVWQKT